MPGGYTKGVSIYQLLLIWAGVALLVVAAVLAVYTRTLRIDRLLIWVGVALLVVAAVLAAVALR